MSVSDLEQVVTALTAAPSVAVLAHIQPEGDAIGATLGASLSLLEAGKVAVAHVADALPRGLRHLPGADRLVRGVPIARPYACYLVLDTSDLSRAGGLLDGRPPDAVVVNVDHHPGNTRFGDVNWVDPGASSAGEMVYQVLRRGGFPVSKAVAANLYAAILTDTGSFQYPNATPQALRVAADLVECGAVPEEITHGLYGDRDPREWRLLSEALASLQVSPDGKLAWIEVTLAAQARAGLGLESTEEFINYVRVLSGVQIAMTFKETSAGLVKVSFRSRGTTDVARLAGQFGGGGHRNAAGCTLTGPLPEVQARVLPAAEAALM
jgi:bifunctional oligoribonuclease and PAP phosphatase NrnA